MLLRSYRFPRLGRPCGLFEIHLYPKEPLNKSHRGRCGKKRPQARRLRGRISAVGCRNGCEATAGQANREANTVRPVPRHEAKGFLAFGLDFRNP